MLKVALSKKGNEITGKVNRDFLDMIETVYDTDGNDVKYYDGIFKDAERNTAKTSCIGFFMDVMPMLSNENNFLGAGVMCSSTFMDMVFEKINSDFIYILPSSIHEVIVVNPNYTEIKESEITEMVRNINTTLDPDIVLSDSVYKYFGKGKWEVIS